jgi:hypothetical protein
VDGSVETYLLLGLVLSVIGSLGAMVLVAVVFVRLPADYFCDSSTREFLPNRHPFLRRAVLFLKNVLGAVLLMVGVILSVPGIPGPGILTVLIALMLLDFRNKRRVERWVISCPLIMRGINSLRRRYGKAPLTNDHQQRRV